MQSVKPKAKQVSLLILQELVKQGRNKELNNL